MNLDRDNENVIIVDNYLLSEEVHYSACVVVYLYYENKIEKYLRYIKCVPQEIDIYIISPNDKILFEVNNILHRDNAYYIKKPNIGRDVSALLVSSAAIVQKYDFFCFLHDKQGKSSYHTLYVEEWEKYIWENLLGSSIACRNILFYMQNNSKIGLLVPPLLMTKYQVITDEMEWGRIEKKNTEDVLKRVLKKDYTIDTRYHSIAIGTAFWARTDSLTRLLKYSWKYEDFPQEPIPNSGTINHAIERCLPYVAAEAGYNTKRILTTSFAEKNLFEKDIVIETLLKLYSREFGICSVDFAEQYMAKKNTILEYCKNKKYIYLYGAGVIGKNALTFMNKIVGIQPRGFIDGQKKGGYFEGCPVYDLNEIEIGEDVGIIVTVGITLLDEVKSLLCTNGYYDFAVFI